MSSEKVRTINPTYSQDDQEKIAKINRWFNPEEGRTGAELSRMTNIKEGTRSSILNGSYASSPTKFLNRMLDAIDRQHERERSGKADIPYTETSIAKVVTSACRRAHNDRDFGIFSGRVGTGKTTALRQYVKTTPSAVLIEAFEGIDHSTFMRELIASTGATIIKGTAAAQMANLIRALKGSDRVILVDEANWLPKRSFGALRRISDVAEIGIVLVGTQELLPMVQDPDGRFGQISSRIGFWPPVAKQITQSDTAELVNSYFGEVMDDSVLKAFYECCEGSARTLRNLLRNTWRNTRKSKTVVSADLIRKINMQTMAGRNFVVGRV